MKPTKKEQLEITAKELFWKHGFKKVSIDEICKKANVSRKTFYTFYSNKNDLIIYLHTKMSDETYVIYKEIIESDLTFSEKLEKLFSYKLEATKNLSMEFIDDLYNPGAEELMTFFKGTIDKSIKFMSDFLCTKATMLYSSERFLSRKFRQSFNIDKAPPSNKFIADIIIVFFIKIF